MVLCPGCGEELIRLVIPLEEGKRKEVWSHPFNPFKKCDYQQDGLKVTIEVIDELLMSKFQELIQKEGINSPLKEEVAVPLKEMPLKRLELSLKQRLAGGSIGREEYKAIELLLKEVW